MLHTTHTPVIGLWFPVYRTADDCTLHTISISRDSSPKRAIARSTTDAGCEPLFLTLAEMQLENLHFTDHDAVIYKYLWDGCNLPR